jgi:hypothetical protein
MMLTMMNADDSSYQLRRRRRTSLHNPLGGGNEDNTSGVGVDGPPHHPLLPATDNSPASHNYRKQQSTLMTGLQDPLPL